MVCLLNIACYWYCSTTFPSRGRWYTRQNINRSIFCNCDMCIPICNVCNATSLAISRMQDHWRKRNQSQIMLNVFFLFDAMEEKENTAFKENVWYYELTQHTSVAYFLQNVHSIIPPLFIKFLFSWDTNCAVKLQLSKRATQGCHRNICVHQFDPFQNQFTVYIWW